MTHEEAEKIVLDNHFMIDRCRLPELIRLVMISYRRGFGDGVEKSAKVADDELERQTNGLICNTAMIIASNIRAQLKEGGSNG